jgi:hypothetical protein
MTLHFIPFFNFKNRLRAVLFSIILAHEFFNAARRVDKFLLSRIKRMALRANFNFHVANCRTGLKRTSAGTRYSTHSIFWVNIFFHFTSP